MTILDATKEGRLAFHNNKGSAPCLNQTFLNNIFKFVDSKENTKKMTVVKLMKAYIIGWHAENLK